MGNEFNDLFNDFFRKGTESNQVHEELKKLIKTISNFKAVKDENELEKEIQEQLGDPNEIQEITEDGIVFKKMIWNTPHGQFVKIVILDVEPDVKPDVEPEILSLDEQLEIALEEEDYELAIKLRDQMNLNKTILK